MKLFQPQGIPPAFSTIGRASNGTYVDVDGVLRTQGPDTARLQDGVYLIEPAATNLLSDPEAFDAGSWVKQGTTVAPNHSGPAPTGQTGVADLVLETAANESHNLYAVGSTSGRSFSVFAKAAGTRYLGVWGFAGGTVVGRTFDLQTGTAGAIWPGSATLVASIIEPLANGWYRVGIESSVAFSVCVLQLKQTDTAGEETWAGNTANGILLWGADAESQSITSYTATTRAADTLTQQPSDLTGGSGAAGGHILVSATDYYGLWISNSSYVAGNRITYRGSLYELAPDVTYNTGDEPGVSPKWLRVGPTNRLAMLDGEVDSKSYDNPLPNLRGPQVGILCSTQGPIDSVLVAALEGATHLTVVVSASLYGPEVFRQTVTLDPGASALRSQYLFTGFAAAAGAVVQIGAWRYPNSPTQFPGVGLIAWGQAETLGCTEWGPRAGIKDYSRKEPDQFGQVVFVRRAFSKTVSATVEVLNPDINTTYDRLASLRATPVVWIFSDDPAYTVPLVVYGFYKDFYATYPRFNSTQFALEVEGLT